MNYPVLQSRVRGSKSEQNFEDVLNSTPSNADAASAPTTPSLEEKVPLWTRHLFIRHYNDYMNQNCSWFFNWKIA